MLDRSFMTVSGPTEVDLQQIGLDAETMGDREFVVIKFGAPWCGPCRTVDKSLDELKQSHGASLVVKKIDIGEEPKLASDFHVSVIPRLVLVKGGKVLDVMVGSRSRAALAEWVEAAGAAPGSSPVSAARMNPHTPESDALEAHASEAHSRENRVPETDLNEAMPPVMPVNLTPRQDKTPQPRQGIRQNPFDSA